MELRALPKSLGFGFYISDSEDSVDSAIAQWLENGCPEDPSSQSSPRESPTVYESAVESSAEDNSESDLLWEQFLDSEFFRKRTLFPDPPQVKSSVWELNCQKSIRSALSSSTLELDEKLNVLEERRKKRIFEIESEFIENLVCIKLKYGVEESEEVEQIEQELAGKSRPSSSVRTAGSSSASLRATSTDLNSNDNANSVKSRSTQAETAPEERNEIKSTQTEPELEQVKTEQTKIEEIRNEQVKTEERQELCPSPSLLAMSEQMGVPNTVPPAETLFSLNAVEPLESMQEDTQLAFHASKNAIEFEQFHKQIAQELITMMGDYGTNVCNRSICKAIDKRMKMDVQQISAVEHQVRAKINSILNTLRELENSPGVIYGYAQFARYLINKCAGISDNMVFAIAKVAIAVIEKHRKLLSLLLSFLHEVSVLTVPKYYSTTNTSLKGTLLDKLGFRDVSGAEKDRKETTDEFITRQSGYVKFYAAFIELDRGIHGLRYGWSYLSRMLNNLPPSRITASALMAFLKVSGYSLFKRYKRQFFKVLLYIHSTFLVSLARSKDEESQAVYMRLQTYLQEHQFTKPPEWKTLKVTAASRNIMA